MGQPQTAGGGLCESLTPQRAGTSFEFFETMVIGHILSYHLCPGVTYVLLGRYCEVTHLPETSLGYK